jgi:hypothetical protein
MPADLPKDYLADGESRAQPQGQICNDHPIELFRTLENILRRP